MKGKIRRSLCILLGVLIAFPSAALFAYADTNELKMFVAADVHFRHLDSFDATPEHYGLSGSEMYFHADAQGQMNVESEAILYSLLDDFENSDSRVMLIPGDVTDTGYLTDHNRLAEILSSFEQRTGKQIFVICGNHDLTYDVNGSSSEATYVQFKSIYADLGYNQALSVHSATASYTAELDSNYRLLAIDTCKHGLAGGCIGDDLMEWIDEQIADAKRDGKKLIAMAHHNFLEHFPLQSPISGDFVVDGYRGLSTHFADNGIKYIFTGHFHTNDISMATTPSGNTIYDVQTSALNATPNIYRRVILSDEKVDIKSSYITKIDVSHLPEGMTAKQVALLGTDFPRYSSEYFVAGVEWWILSYIGTPQKIANALNVEEGTPEYELLGELMNVLCDVLTMPLYDPGTPEVDSLQEIAALGGETFPQSNYKTVPQLAADVLNAFFAGDENLKMDDPEIRLLLSCVKAALTYTLVNAADDVLRAETFFVRIGRVHFLISKHLFKPRVVAFFGQAV